MSATVDWIVDLDVSLDEAVELAKRVKAWFIAREIVSPTLCPQRSFGGGDLMCRGTSAAEWDACPQISQCSMCGLETVIERRVYDTGDSGIESIRCPACGGSHHPDDVPWSDAVGAWFSAEADYTMKCPACHTSRSIVD